MENWEEKKVWPVDYGNLGNVYRVRVDLDRAVNYWKLFLALFIEIAAAREIEQMQSLLDDIAQ